MSPGNTKLRKLLQYWQGKEQEQKTERILGSETKNTHFQ